MTPPLPNAASAAPAPHVEVLKRLTPGRARTKKAAPTGYMVSPIFDMVLIILSPLFALGFGWIVSQDAAAHERVNSGFLHDQFGFNGSPLGFLMGVIIMAHIFAVFFRSHGNRTIFSEHKLSFTLIPVLWFVALISSSWALVITSVAATWWDVYHSGAQTFGIGRIYDAKAGNAATVGRRLDFWLQQLLYAGPILAGATMMDHVEEFDEFEAVGATFFTAIPAQVEGVASWLTFAVLAIGVPFLAYYFVSYRKLIREGYRVSMQKVVLYTVTGGVSIYAWAFNSFGEAFVIMNLFHAVQYFAIVWAVEKKSMRGLFRLEKLRWGVPITLALFLATTAAYGVAVELFDHSGTFMAAALVISCLHFWYDGFVWSVRKGQV